LSGAEADACDLTQQTFYLWATRGHQLRDLTKVKTWLFTTLYREYLSRQRRVVRFPHQQLEETEAELPVVAPPNASRVDGKLVLQALAGMAETFRAPIALFYLEDYSYQEIAEVLEVPVGTVKSRISRGLVRLQALMADESSRTSVAAGRESHD